MDSVVTVIFYDLIDKMTDIEFYIVANTKDLKKQVAAHQLCDNATVKWYDRKGQIAFAISGGSDASQNSQG